MNRNFLSVDWDYFIKVHNEKSNSYRETQQDILAKWYNEWILGVENGNPLEQHYELTDLYQTFKEQYLPKIKYRALEGSESEIKLNLTESHVAGYQFVIESGCDVVYHLDAHSDLGYGGLAALDYETNCANWLGILLKEKRIKKAYIIYSPYTKEYPEEFQEIVERYPVEFIELETFLRKQPEISCVHMCRSGPWAPPWYDGKFYEFASAFGLPIEDYIGGKRPWHPTKLTLAEKINFKLGIV